MAAVIILVAWFVGDMHMGTAAVPLEYGSQL